MSNEYFARWYAENREKLSQRRKERYLNDPNYREKVLLNSKRSRKSVLQVSEDGGSGRAVGADGVERNCYTVSEAASLLDLSRETVIQWEKLGVIPADPFARTPRCYTVGQVQGIRKAIEAHRNGTKRIHVRKENIGFTAMISEHWSNLPEVKG